MTDQLTAALAYAQDNRDRFLDELKAFVRIPSISTDPSAKPEMQRAAQWVTGRVSTGGGGAPDPDPIIHEWIEKAVTDR